MSKQTTVNPQRSADKQLTLRAIVIGALGSALLTASSMYVALRMGALPWPTVFAAIASMTILKLLGNTSLNEINVAQTAMTAGAMISGGLAFTLPGLWAGGTVEISHLFLNIFFVALAGLILGLVLTWYWRPMLLEHEKLPFPIGIATAETIKAGDEGGKKAILLGGALALTSLVTLIRDWFGKLPQMLTFSSLAPFNIQAGIMLWPMAPAIGYMIGTLYTGVLLAGALTAYFLIVPLGIAFHLFADAAAAVTFKNTLGLGLMVGSGLGVLLKFFLERLQRPKKPVSIRTLAQNKLSNKKSGYRIAFFLAAGRFGQLLGGWNAFGHRGAGAGIGRADDADGVPDDRTNRHRSNGDFRNHCHDRRRFSH